MHGIRVSVLCVNNILHKHSSSLPSLVMTCDCPCMDGLKSLQRLNLGSLESRLRIARRPRRSGVGAAERGLGKLVAVRLLVAVRVSGGRLGIARRACSCRIDAPEWGLREVPVILVGVISRLLVLRRAGTTCHTSVVCFGDQS